MKRIVFFILTICVFLACKKESPESTIETTIRITEEAALIVDNKIEEAFKSDGYVDPVTIAQEIRSIKSVRSATVNETGSGIIIEQDDGIYCNIYVVTEDDERMFIVETKTSFEDADKGIENFNGIFIHPNGSGKALILAPFQSYMNTDLDKISELFALAGYTKIDKYLNSAATLDKFRGGFLNDYDIVFIRTHGNAHFTTSNGTKTTILTTGERINKESWDDLSGKEKDAISYDCVVDGKSYFGISVPWLNLTIDGKFTNSWIYVGACESSYWDAGSGSFSEAFLKLGAGGYNGFDYEVYTDLSNLVVLKMTYLFSSGLSFHEASSEVRKEQLLKWKPRYPNSLYRDVRCFDDHQLSLESFYLFDKGSAPNNPSSPNPANGTSGVPTSLTLSWTCSDPDVGDILTFNVFFGTTNNPTTQIGTNLTNASITKSGLSQGVIYYWKVVAKDNHSNSTTSPIWSFTTAPAVNNPPATPSSPNPANAATGVSTAPTLSWSCSDPDGDALTYDVYLGTTSNPTTTIATNQTATSIARTGLSNSTPYYWKIVAKDSKGATTPGPVWSFTTQPNSGIIPTNGLVAYYPFNGNANDQSGNNNNGTVYGATLTADRHGISNRAYLFDGINNYIEINHSASLNLSQQISISFWAKFETESDYYWPYHIIEKYGCWGLGQREDDMNWGVTTTVGEFNIFVLTFEYDRFYHFVMTYDGSKLSTYVDGVLKGSVAANGAIIQNTNNVYISRYNFGGNYFFDGVLDDFRIYNRALTQQEITALYNE